MSGSAPRPLPDLPLAYPVHVGRGLLSDVGRILQETAPAHRFALVSDDTVAPLHAQQVLAGMPEGRHTGLFTIPAGESEKTRARWGEITDAMFAWGAGRDTTVIALGGGVVGDMAGFVAATFMRGVPVVQVPTTLLAMVDAAVGGKTGVDTPQGKNLVGAFHDPSAVVMAVESLATLPADAFRSGLAEIIKHGIIADRSYYEATRRALPDLAALGANSNALHALIEGSVRIKAGVVADDAREGGRRQILNFGHTIAHTIEHAMHYHMLHGDAVAVGMVVEARIAEALGVAAPGLAAEIEDLLRSARLPTEVPERLGLESLLAGTRLDKKARAGGVRYALPRRIGEMEPGDGSWSVEVPDAVVMAALR